MHTRQALPPHEHSSGSKAGVQNVERDEEASNGQARKSHAAFCQVSERPFGASFCFKADAIADGLKGRLTQPSHGPDDDTGLSVHWVE